MEPPGGLPLSALSPEVQLAVGVALAELMEASVPLAHEFREGVTLLAPTFALASSDQLVSAPVPLHPDVIVPGATGWTPDSVRAVAALSASGLSAPVVYGQAPPPSDVVAWWGNVHVVEVSFPRGLAPSAGWTGETLVLAGLSTGLLQGEPLTVVTDRDLAGVTPDPTQSLVVVVDAPSSPSWARDLAALRAAGSDCTVCSLDLPQDDVAAWLPGLAWVTIDKGRRDARFQTVGDATPRYRSLEQHGIELATAAATRREAEDRERAESQERARLDAQARIALASEQEARTSRERAAAQAVTTSQRRAREYDEAVIFWRAKRNRVLTAMAVGAMIGAVFGGIALGDNWWMSMGVLAYLGGLVAGGPITKKPKPGDF